MSEEKKGKTCCSFTKCLLIFLVLVAAVIGGSVGVAKVTNNPDMDLWVKIEHALHINGK